MRKEEETKKYLIDLLGVVVFIRIMSWFYLYGKNRYYDYHTTKLHSKLLKETIIDLKDSDCYKRYGIYKRIYRKYDYYDPDSTRKSRKLDDNHFMEYCVNSVGDTVFMEFVDTSDYPRRED